MSKFSENLAAQFYADMKKYQQSLEIAKSELAAAELQLASVSAENSRLKEKIEKITSFHSYKVGQHVVEAKKSWGTILGGMIGSWKYYASVREIKDSNTPKKP